MTLTSGVKLLPFFFRSGIHKVPLFIESEITVVAHGGVGGRVRVCSLCQNGNTASSHRYTGKSRIAAM